MYLNRYKACQILNLNPFSELTNDEIKKAYRKKVLEVHPDKTLNTSTDEFANVQMAKDLLINNVDLPFSLGIYSDLVEKAIGAIKKYMKTQPQYTSASECDPMATAAASSELSSDDEFFESDTPQTCDIRLELNISISELYSEKGKKLTVRYRTDLGDYAKRTVYIAFVDYNVHSIFKGFGDWNTFECKYGDLIVELCITKNKDTIINSCIDKLDLIRYTQISIYEFYYGFETEFYHFNETIKIKHNPSVDGADIVMSGKGLQGVSGRGELYIIFDVDLKSTNPKQMCPDRIYEFFPPLL